MNQFHGIIEDEMNQKVYENISSLTDKVLQTINLLQNKIKTEEYFDGINHCIFTTNLDGFEKLRIPWMIKNHMIYKYKQEGKHEHKSCMIEKVTVEDTDVLSGKSVNLNEERKMEQP